MVVKSVSYFVDKININAQYVQTLLSGSKFNKILY